MKRKSIKILERMVQLRLGKLIIDLCYFANNRPIQLKCDCEDKAIYITKVLLARPVLGNIWNIDAMVSSRRPQIPKFSKSFQRK